MTKFPSMGHRAWFAYQCLDRDDHGEAPSYRGLEDAVGLSNNQLRKLIYDKLKRPGWEQLEKMARALKVTPAWLKNEEGPGPVARWPVVPRPNPPKAAKKSASISPKARAEFERDAQQLGKGVGHQRRRRASE